MGFFFEIYQLFICAVFIFNCSTCLGIILYALGKFLTPLPHQFWVVSGYFLDLNPNDDKDVFKMFMILDQILVFPFLCLLSFFILKWMIKPNVGPCIEKLISFAMGKDDNDPITDNHKRVVATHCFFVITQLIIAEIAGHLVNLYPSGWDPAHGVVAISLVWVCVFKLFAAAPEYYLTISGHVLSQFLTLQLLVVAFPHPHLTTVAEFGPIVVHFAIYAMLIPVDKLYTFIPMVIGR